MHCACTLVAIGLNIDRTRDGELKLFKLNLNRVMGVGFLLVDSGHTGVWRNAGVSEFEDRSPYPRGGISHWGELHRLLKPEGQWKICSFWTRAVLHWRLRRLMS